MKPLVAAAVAVVLGASCAGGPPPAEDVAAGERPRCSAIPGRALEGFVLVDTEDVPESGHIGVRRTVRDPDDGREVTYLLGIIGEVGEGFPAVGTRLLRSGPEARLLGHEDRWALVWEEAEPCRQSAILGSGMDQDGFEDLMEEAGVLTAEG